MWSLEDYRRVFFALGIIGVFLFSIPSALLVIRWPSGEQFSQLYVLGLGHMAQGYPFNVRADENYSVYLGVEANLGSVAYYEVVLKLRNSSEALPNDTSGIPSSLPALYRYEVFLTDGQTWETALNFSFSNVSFTDNISSAGKMNLNGASIQVDKTAAWDSVNNRYYYQLIAELWLYDPGTGSFSFNDRFVALWFNMTSTA
jgi:hypothetical protein